MKVFIIVEKWNNNDDDFYEHKTEILDISFSMDDAQKIINQRKDELIRIANDYSEADPYSDIEVYNVDGGVKFVDTTDEVFHTTCSGKDVFTWDVVPFELEELA